MRKENVMIPFIVIWIMAFLCSDIFAQTAPEVGLQKIRVSPLTDSVKVGELVNFQIIVSNIGKIETPAAFTNFTLEKLYFLMAVSGSGFFSSSASAFTETSPMPPPP
jgi:hypothetical protein